MYLTIESSTDFGDRGAEAIANLLRAHPALQYVTLSHTDVGDDGARSIAAALEENCTLRGLYLPFALRVAAADREYSGTVRTSLLPFLHYLQSLERCKRIQMVDWIYKWHSVAQICTK